MRKNRFAALPALVAFLFAFSCGAGNDQTPEVVNSPQVTITFNANDGSETPLSVTKNADEIERFPSAASLGFERSGFTFLGWVKDKSSLTADYYENQTVEILESVTLYALWVGQSSETEEYTLYFDARGGTASFTEKTYIIGEKYAKLPVATYEGYTFVRWYIMDRRSGLSSTITEDSIVQICMSDKVFAEWKKNEVSYTVTYELDGGVNDADNITSYSEDSRTFTLLEPSKKGYVFQGWWNEDEGRLFTLIEADTKKDITLTARWGKISGDLIEVKGKTVSGAVKNSNIKSEVFIDGRTVEIPHLYVGRHEVTQNEWEEYMDYVGEKKYANQNMYESGSGAHTNGWAFAPSLTYGVSGTPSDYSAYVTARDYPVYAITYYEAVIYCNLRSKAEGLTPVYYMTIDGQKQTDVDEWAKVDGTFIAQKDNGKYYINSKYESASGAPNATEAFDNAQTGIKADMSANGYRLPTEAEWEYIALGGSDALSYIPGLYKYSGSNIKGDVANFASAAGSGSLMQGEKKKKNQLGLYDMSGNQREYCYDWYSTTVTKDTPLTGPETYSAENQIRNHIARGGYWYETDKTVVERNGVPTYRREAYTGFRVVRLCEDAE